MTWGYRCRAGSHVTRPFKTKTEAMERKKATKRAYPDLSVKIERVPHYRRKD